MTAHFEGGRGPLWFYAHSSSHIVQACRRSHPAVFHYIGRGHDLYACIHGEAEVCADEDAIGRYWSDEVARWYPRGSRDPDLALLQVTVTSAEYWDGPSNTMIQIFPAAQRQPVMEMVRKLQVV